MVMSKPSGKNSRESLASGIAGMHSLFLRPGTAGATARAGLYQDALDLLQKLLSATFDNGFLTGVSCVNALFEAYPQQRLFYLLCECGFAYLADRGALKDNDPEQAFVWKNLNAILQAVDTANALIQNELPGSLSPRAAAFLVLPEHLSSKVIEREVLACDPFKRCRSFVYRNEHFLATELDSIRHWDEFYGFVSIRSLIDDQLTRFVQGQSKVPFLLSSLPGHGKTQLVIANTLKHPDLTLILPTPETLSKHLYALFGQLAQRSDRKFVVFFDDIVPEEIDWFDFRTQVGGSLTLPDNVQIVIAANFPLPPNILSRGRAAQFPLFDEVRCSEMIEEFLKQSGMKHPPRNLISVIGANYCEQFGQKVFTELSPRTLMRYLESYRHDAQKRKAMLEFSQGDLITKPDAQLFYEFNIELMRKMYGEEYIQALLKAELRQMEQS